MKLDQFFTIVEIKALKETTKPLPCPLITVFKDQVRMKNIQDHPKLFKIVCQIDADVLERLMVDHPNQPFTQSVLCDCERGSGHTLTQHARAVVGRLTVIP